MAASTVGDVINASHQLFHLLQFIGVDDFVSAFD